MTYRKIYKGLTAGGDSIEEFEEYLKKFYGINYISEGG